MKTHPIRLSSPLAAAVLALALAAPLRAQTGAVPSTPTDGDEAAAVSHNIRSSVGDPSRNDDNTTTGTSSVADPNNQPHGSLPVTSGNGTPVQSTGSQPVAPAQPTAVDSGARH